MKSTPIHSEPNPSPHAGSETAPAGKVSSNGQSLVSAKGLTKRYESRHGTQAVTAVEIPEIQIDAGEFVIIHGPSGCGKTTLLMMLGAMLHPTSGSIHFDDRDLYSLTPTDRSRLRNRSIGFVFQTFHLIPYLSVRENVLLPAASQRTDETAIQSRCSETLARLGLTDRTNHRPDELSAGERQRTALARALVNQPRLLLADEPTGNLDPQNSREVYEHMKQFQEAGGTVVVVSHRADGDPYATRILSMQSGTLLNKSSS